MSIITTFLSFFSCKSKEEKYLENHKVILYGTKEFDKFESIANIKLDKAVDIQIEFAKKNHEDPKSIFFIIDDYYVFSMQYNEKTPYVSINGIWVNVNNGDVKHLTESDITLRRYYK